MTSHPKRFLFFLACVFMLVYGQAGLADEPSVIGSFSEIDPATGLPTSWEPLNFPNVSTPTDYRPIKMDGRTVIEARSKGAASGLVHPAQIDPHRFPWLLWRWRIEQVLKGGDVTAKSGDDCAARIYVAFKFDGRGKSWWERIKYKTTRFFAGYEIPGSALVYAWANKADTGRIVDSPYTDQSKLIVVQSGNGLKDQWISEKRNLVDDYQSAFGAPPPTIMGIAIMTDTDNTGEATTAFYGDVRLQRNALKPVTDGILKPVN